MTPHNSIAHLLDINPIDSVVGFRDGTGRLVTIIYYIPAREGFYEAAFSAEQRSGRSNPAFSFTNPERVNSRAFCRRFLNRDTLDGLCVEQEVRQPSRYTRLESEFHGWARRSANLNLRRQSMK